MSIAVSAPGKVLFAGGYLVLNRNHTGLVFGLSARIHVLVSEGGLENQVTVRSPQFKNASWVYDCSFLNDKKGVKVTQSVASNHGSIKIPPIQITILADPDFYSHNPTSSQMYPRFPVFDVPLSGAHKTGLGSSATLVTALTAAVLIYNVPTFDLNAAVYRTKLHNLAQAAHCAAQGKIGSGFDIAAAVYGTCVYRRFSPSILENVGEPNTPGFASRIEIIVDNAEGIWDVEIQKQRVILPTDWALVMCDVNHGSATVNMVREVLRWCNENSHPANLAWTELQRLQETLIQQLNFVDAKGVRQSLEKIRYQIHQVTAMSGVPIEPIEQKTLIDTINKNIEEVIGGVVPGAGGYDAIALLVKDKEKTINDLTAFLKSWSRQTGKKFKLLSVKEESEGIRVEEYENYTKSI